MMGAIVGDIIGSVHEFSDRKSCGGPLFAKESTFTDDTVLSMATAFAILSGSSYEGCYVDFFSRYSNLSANGGGTPGIGYGPHFTEWAMTPEHLREPYGSLGNGSAMRIGPIGWAFNTLEEVLSQAQRSAECTHNHPEGVRGAQAVAAAIWMARRGRPAKEIEEHLESAFGYDMLISLDYLHRTYAYDMTCPGSVPPALACALQADSFESAMRNCLYIGGDTDTIAAIAGAVAEPLFGLPRGLRNQAAEILDRHAPELMGIVDSFEVRYGSRVIPDDKANKGLLVKMSNLLRAGFRRHDMHGK